mgnify:FL=1|jgi:hypothetical protein
MINPIITIIHILFDFIIVEPIELPIGMMLISTPTKKRVNPKITNTELIINLMINSASIGVRVKFKTNTMIVIGRTEYKTSLNF